MLGEGAMVAQLEGGSLRHVGRPPPDAGYQRLQTVGSWMLTRMMAASERSVSPVVSHGAEVSARDAVADVVMHPGGGGGVTDRGGEVADAGSVLVRVG